MLLVKIFHNDYLIWTSSKNKLAKHTTNCIAKCMNFNLNMIFQIKILKN